ncbi:MAG: hypothetical protein Q9166_002299 [cf. Caloplaca sp. 2 TL-2023]
MSRPTRPLYVPIHRRIASATKGASNAQGVGHGGDGSRPRGQMRDDGCQVRRKLHSWETAAADGAPPSAGKATTIEQRPRPLMTAVKLVSRANDEEKAKERLPAMYTPKTSLPCYKQNGKNKAKVEKGDSKQSILHTGVSAASKSLSIRGASTQTHQPTENCLSNRQRGKMKVVHILAVNPSSKHHALSGEEDEKERYNGTLNADSSSESPFFKAQPMYIDDDEDEGGFAEVISVLPEQRSSTTPSVNDHNNHNVQRLLTVNHLPSIVDYSWSSPREQSYTGREENSSSMPPYQGSAQNWRDRDELQAHGIAMSSGPRLPGWLAMTEANNPAKSVACSGIQIPRTLEPSNPLNGPGRREANVSPRLATPTPTNPSGPAEETQPWISSGGSPLPEQVADPNTYYNSNFIEDQHPREKNVLVARPSLGLLGKETMALRDQSTNFAPLPSTAKFRDENGYITAQKERSIWGDPHLRPAEKKVVNLPERPVDRIPPHLRVPVKKAEEGLDKQIEGTALRSHVPLKTIEAGSKQQSKRIAPHLRVPVKEAEEATTKKAQVQALHSHVPGKKSEAEPEQQSGRIAPHLRVPAERVNEGSNKKVEGTALFSHVPARTIEAEPKQEFGGIAPHSHVPCKIPERGQVKPVLSDLKEEISCFVQPKDPDQQPHNQPPPQFPPPPTPPSRSTGHPLMTDSSDFLSRAAETLNNLKHTLPSHAESPDSTDITVEVAIPDHKVTSPAATTTEASPSNAAPAAPPTPPIVTMTPLGPTITPFPIRQNTVQQERGADQALARQDHETHNDPVNKSPSPNESAGHIPSDISVRGQADENNLSSIPKDEFFEHAYHGRDASIASEIVFEGRRPKNPFRIDNPAAIPGWEGAEIPDYEPGQLRGWDGNWQEAPVEWDRRDLYDYTTQEHRNNVKNYIDDRYEAYKRGRCPALPVESDPVFMSGRALAVGGSAFGKPIPSSEHHHLPPSDPFSLGKLTKTANMATENYLRVHAKRLAEQEKRDSSAADNKKAAKAKRAAEQQAREQALIEAAYYQAPNSFSPKVNIYVRPAQVKDLYQVRNIHNHYVRTLAAAGENVELPEREWRTRFDDCEAEKLPFLVAILVRHGRMDRGQGKAERVVGFTYAEDFAGEHTMWGHTCEIQLFVDRHYLRQGIGKNLMDCLLRGINPAYQAKRAIEFIFTPGQNDRYEGGGERVFSSIIFPLPYDEDEEERAQWIGTWLVNQFQFDMQGLLKGVGRKQTQGKR